MKINKRPLLGDYLKNSKKIRALLAIDLGNSRTGMAVVDHINEPGYQAETYTDISLGNGSAFEKAQPGPFDSLVACMVDDESFVRIGEHARQIGQQLKEEVGEKSLSSPKRYFFDMAPSRGAGWRAGKPKDTRGAFESGWLSGKLAEGLARRYGCDQVTELPRAGLLGGMVVELYIQAMRFMNSEDFKEKTNDNRARFISDVHVTYPTTLTDDEKARYKLQIDKALRVYIAIFGDKYEPFINVRSDTDEAIAVLGHFAERAIARAGGNVPAWLATFGRKDGGHYIARVAVIDIGGGTTDLSIADICENGAEKATVLQLFLDGVNRAGDDVIAELVKSVLFDKVAKAIIGSAGGVTVSDVRDEYNEFGRKNADIIRSLISVAIEALLSLDVTGVSKNVDIKLAKTSHDRKAFESLRKQIIDGAPEVNWAAELKISLSSQDRATLRERMTGVLLPMLKKMGQEIAAFDCDLLVVSGKITSVPAVYDLLGQCVPLPPWAIINMNGTVGNDEDVKFATVRGGAQAALHALGVTNAPCHIEFIRGQDLKSGYDWGRTTNLQNLRISAAMGTKLEKTHDGCVAFRYENQTVYLLRQRAGGWGTVAISHEITKRDPHTPVAVADNVVVTLSVKAGRVFIRDVSGGGFGVDDFECRVHGFTDGRHWMDHGRIE